MRTFVRILIGDDGRTVASVFQVRPRRSILAFLTSKPPEESINAVEFETVFEDWSSYVTCNHAAPNALNTFPNIAWTDLEPETPVEMMFATHRQAIENRTREGLVKPLFVSTFEEVISISRTIHELKAQFKRKIGYVRREDFESMLTGFPPRTRKKLLHDLDKIRRKAGLE
jgi:hypothetical protein